MSPDGAGVRHKVAVLSVAESVRQSDFIEFPHPMTNSRIPFPFLPFLPTSSVHRWLSMHIRVEGTGPLLCNKLGRGEL